MKDFKVFIFYVNQFIQDNNKTIFGIIEEILSENFELCKDFINIFKDKKIYLRDMYHILIFLEKLGFFLIKKDIGKNYNEKLPEKKKEAINKYFNFIQSIEQNDTLITKETLCSALRKIITRIILYNKIQVNDRIYLNINNIWEFDIQNNNKFELELKSIENFGIKYKQIITFYEFLGGDLNNVYDGINKNKKEENKVNILEYKSNDISVNKLTSLKSKDILIEEESYDEDIY